MAVPAINTRAIVLIAVALYCQGPSYAQRLVFEVASVKPNTTSGPAGGATPSRSGELVMFHNTQPYSLIFYAYDLKGSYQMVGYPSLPDTWRWVDIDARTGQDATDDEVRLMMQSLLEERFKLKVHRETRDLPGYVLTIAKGTANVPPSKGSMKAIVIDGRTYPPPKPGTCGGITLWRDGARIVCHAVAMDAITSQLRNALKSPVVDRTGLMETYDLNLRYVPDDRVLEPNMEPGPSLAKALQEELGLTLQKVRAPVEVLVVDHLEKPSEN